MSVVVVGLDGAERSLVERFMAEGALPTLAALRARGSFAPLTTSADAFAGSVWPTLLYGVGPGVHGYCGGYPIRPGTYDVAPADLGENRLAPFCAGLDALVIDVPKSKPVDAPGLRMLCAWGAHAARGGPSSAPAGLLDDVVGAVGRYPLPLLAQEDDVHSVAYYRSLRDRLLDGVRARRALHRHLQQQQPPAQLVLTVFGEPHVVGHRFWHFMDERHPWHDPGAPAELRSAIRDVYAAVDGAVGELLALLPGDADVVVVSSHGMGSSRHAHELLPQVVARLAGGGGRRRMRASATLALAARRLAPPALRAALKRRLPGPVRQAVRARYLAAAFGASRWPEQRAFCTPTEDNGYVRLNLRGREPRGLVSPSEGRALLDELCGELALLVDGDSGERVVAGFVRPQERYPGPHAPRMPDLVVQFTPGPPARRLRSPRLGELERAPGTTLQHRSGDHQPGGFVVAAGPQVRAAAVPGAADLVDIAPTVLRLLGRPAPPHLSGRVLEELLRR